MNENPIPKYAVCDGNYLFVYDPESKNYCWSDEDGGKIWASSLAVLKTVFQQLLVIPE